MQETVFSDYPNFRAGIEIKPSEGQGIASREEYLKYASLLTDIYIVTEVSYVMNASGFYLETDKPQTFELSFSDTSMETI